MIVSIRYLRMWYLSWAHILSLTNELYIKDDISTLCLYDIFILDIFLIYFLPILVYNLDFLCKKLMLDYVTQNTIY